MMICTSQYLSLKDGYKCKYTKLYKYFIISIPGTDYNELRALCKRHCNSLSAKRLIADSSYKEISSTEANLLILNNKIDTDEYYKILK